MTGALVLLLNLNMPKSFTESDNLELTNSADLQTFFFRFSIAGPYVGRGVCVCVGGGGYVRTPLAG